MTTRLLVPTRSSKAGCELPPPLRSASWPTWVKCLPFLGMHLGCLAVFFVQPTAAALVLCAVLYVVRMFGITAGFHRYFSHRAYKTSRWFQFVLGCIGCTAMQKGPLWWAGLHRQHHRYTDTRLDPHSPVVRGFWWSHIGWILARDYEETNWPAVHDLGKYQELRWLNRNHWVPGLVLAVLCYLSGGWSGLVWGVFVSTVLVYHAVFMVNSVCHLFGRWRNATPDQSRNNVWLALATFGEGWHNNHHHYQSSTNQGFFWWELDVSYYLIKWLGCVGFVWDIRKPPRAVLLVSEGATAGIKGTPALEPPIPADADAATSQQRRLNMSVPCDIIIQWSATPEQLSALGAALWRWCSRVAGNTGIYQCLDNQALADLIAGKLPVSSQPPLYADRRGVHFPVGDKASQDRQATLDRLRRELPAGGIEDVVVDGTSWNSVASEGRTRPAWESTHDQAPGSYVLHPVER